MGDNLIHLERKNNDLVKENSSARKRMIVDTIAFNTSDKSRLLLPGDIIVAVLRDDHTKILGGITKVKIRNGVVSNITVRFPLLDSERYKIEIYHGEIHIIDLDNVSTVEDDLDHVLNGAMYFMYDGELSDDSSPLFTTEERISQHIDTIIVNGKEFMISTSSNGLKTTFSRHSNGFPYTKFKLSLDDIEDCIEEGMITIVDGMIHFDEKIEQKDDAAE